MKHILFLLFVMPLFLLYGQEGNLNSDMVPQFGSPEVAELGKHISVPVSLNTGTPNIAIPVYTISYGGIDFPITLSYDATGVKVQDVSGYVGLKWNLNVGGAVTRIIKGAADEGSIEGANNTTSIDITGWYKDYGLTTLEDQLANIDYAYSGSYGVEHERAHQLSDFAGFAGQGVCDTQPDLFAFNASGVSGRFIFDENRIPTLLTEGDTKIKTYFSGGSFNTFEIDNYNGIRYIFGENEVKERSQNTAPDDLSNSLYQDSAWHLTSIVNQKNNQSIAINYIPVSYYYLTPVFKSGVAAFKDHDFLLLPGQTTDTDISLSSVYSSFVLQNNIPSFNKTHINSHLVSSIEAGNILVEFNYSSREDVGALFIESPPKKLDEIVVRYNGICIKKFQFNYTYSNADSGTSNAGSGLSLNNFNLGLKRLVLNSVVEESCNGSVSKSYQFIYNDTPLPSRYSYAQDKWGYFNGVLDNNSLYPKYLAVDNQYIADRAISLPHSLAGTLTEIIYPTGGSTTFEFENHQNDEIVSYEFNNWDNVGSLISLSELDGSDDMSFNYNSLKAYRLNVYLYEGVPYNLHDTGNDCDWINNEGNAVEVINTQSGEVVYSVPYSLLFDEGENYQFSRSFVLGPEFFTPGLTYTVVAYGGHDFFGGDCLTTEVYLKSADAVPNYDVGGLRIKKVSYKDTEGMVIKEENYTYAESNLISNPVPVYRSNYSRDWSFNGLTSPSYLADIYPSASNFGTGEFVYCSTGQNPFMLDFSGSHISYNKVNVINSEGRTEHRYYPAKTYWEMAGYYYVTESPTFESSSINAFPYKPLYQSSKAGYLFQTSIFDADDNLLRRITNTYVPQTMHAIPSRSMQTFEIHRLGDPPNADLLTINDFYDVEAEYLVLTSTVTTDYLNENEVNTSTAYFYEGNNHYQPTRIVATNSKNEETTTLLQYPSDLIGAEPFMAQLVDHNRIEAPVIKTVEKPGQPLSKEVYKFDTGFLHNTNNLVLPKAVETSKNNSVLKTEINYEDFDEKGNILQYRKEDGSVISYIWGYGQTLPIAKLENISYAAINPADIANLQLLSDNDTDAVSEQNFRNALDTLRESYPDVVITGYTYDPLVGVTSIIDSRGYNSFYNYDSLNRLVDIKDKNGNIIDTFDYNYGQETLPVYDPLSVTINYGSDDTDHQWFIANPLGGSGDYSYAWYEGIDASSTDFEVNTSGANDTYQLMVGCGQTKYVKLIVVDNVTGQTAEATKVNNNGCNYPPLNADIIYGPSNDNSQWFLSTVSGGSGSYSYAWYDSVGNTGKVFENTPSSIASSYQMSVPCTLLKKVKLVVTDTVTGVSVIRTKNNNNIPCTGETNEQ